MYRKRHLTRLQATRRARTALTPTVSNRIVHVYLERGSAHSYAVVGKKLGLAGSYRIHVSEGKGEVTGDTANKLLLTYVMTDRGPDVINWGHRPSRIEGDANRKSNAALYKLLTCMQYLIR